MKKKAEIKPYAHKGINEKEDTSSIYTFS